MNQALKKLENAETRLVGQSFQPILEPERDLLAKEIHNKVSQNLVGASFITSALMKRLEKGDAPSSEELSEKLSSLMSLLKILSSSVKDISSQLRPPILDSEGLIPALEWRCKEVARLKKIRCDFKPLDGEIAFEPSEANLLFRIFEKIISQTFQFGSPGEIRVELKRDRGMTTIVIADDGVILDPRSRKGSLRLLGIEVVNEQLKFLGGSSGYKRIGEKNVVELKLPERDVGT